MPICLALIDDHKIARDGLKALLADIDGMQVVAEGTNGRDAIAMTENTGIDVFLMDIAMPGVDGLDATLRILEKNRMRGSSSCPCTPRLTTWPAPFRAVPAATW